MCSLVTADVVLSALGLPEVHKLGTVYLFCIETCRCLVGHREVQSVVAHADSVLLAAYSQGRPKVPSLLRLPFALSVITARRTRAVQQTTTTNCVLCFCRYWKFLAEFITFTSQQAASNANGKGTSQTTLNGQIVLNCLRGTTRSDSTAGSSLDPLANLGASGASPGSNLQLSVALSVIAVLLLAVIALNY